MEGKRREGTGEGKRVGKGRRGMIIPVAAILGVSWCPDTPKICPRGCTGMVGHPQDLATLTVILVDLGNKSTLRR